MRPDSRALSDIAGAKLNLGAGSAPMDGWENLDRKTGEEIYPLNRDGVDEIRASHVLEHFSHQKIPTVLADWVGALKPGGLLKIAVPDFNISALPSRECSSTTSCFSPLQGLKVFETKISGRHVDS